jgi:hypothetical protein
MAYCSILEPIAVYELPIRFLAGSAFFAPAYFYVEERDAQIAAVARRGAPTWRAGRV